MYFLRQSKKNYRLSKKKKLKAFFASDASTILISEMNTKFHDKFTEYGPNYIRILEGISYSAIEFCKFFPTLPFSPSLCSLPPLLLLLLPFSSRPLPVYFLTPLPLSSPRLLISCPPLPTCLSIPSQLPSKQSRGRTSMRPTFCRD